MHDSERKQIDKIKKFRRKNGGKLPPLPAVRRNETGGNPFGLFFAERWKEAKQAAADNDEDDDPTARPQCPAVMATAAQLWRDMTDAERQPYRAKHAQGRRLEVSLRQGLDLGRQLLQRKKLSAVKQGWKKQQKQQQPQPVVLPPKSALQFYVDSCRREHTGDQRFSVARCHQNWRQMSDAQRSAYVELQRVDRRRAARQRLLEKRGEIIIDTSDSD